MSLTTADSYRVMTQADVTSLTRFDPSRIPPLTISTELAAPEYYTWMGIFSNDKLVAVHRGMRWGTHLLLKGLIVAPEFRGSPAGVRLAISLKEHARSVGFSGIAVWVEPSKPEREIAARLRVCIRDLLVHRFEFPLPTGDRSCRSRSSHLTYAGTISIESTGTPMVPDMVTPRCVGNPALHWVSDNGRIVLSGNPCGSVADLPDLIYKVMPIAQSLGATSVELPIMASNLEAMIALVSMGARRLSRTPVYLGLHNFNASSETYGSVAARKLGDATYVG